MGLCQDRMEVGEAVRHFEVKVFYALQRTILELISRTRESFPNSRLKFAKHYFSVFQDHFLLRVQLIEDLHQMQIAHVRYYSVL